MPGSRKKKNKKTAWPGLLMTVLLVVLLIINIAVIAMGKALGSTVLGDMPVAMIPVLSDSMNPSIKSGDAIMTIKTEYEDIKPGDIVVYGRDGDLVVHEVIGILDGALITKGTANPIADMPVSKEEYITKVWFKVPLLGGIWRISTKPFNFILFAVLVTLLVFGDRIFEGIYARLFEKEDGED